MARELKRIRAFCSETTNPAVSSAGEWKLY